MNCENTQFFLNTLYILPIKNELLLSWICHFDPCPSLLKSTFVHEENWHQLKVSFDPPNSFLWTKRHFESAAAKSMRKEVNWTLTQGSWVKEVIA